MYVIKLETSLLCDDQYFKLRCFDIIFLIVLYKCEMIVHVMLWESIVVFFFGFVGIMCCPCIDLMPHTIFSESICLYIHSIPFIHIIICVAVVLVTFHMAEFPGQRSCFDQLMEVEG